MRLGASTLLFRDHPLDGDLLAKMADAGVDAVELTDYHPGFSYDDSAAFGDLRETLDKLGLQLNSLHAIQDEPAARVSGRAPGRAMRHWTV